MKIFFVSLGCDKNLVDSEHMLGLLRGRGHEITSDVNEADAIVVNTCCFIKDAKEESIQTIIDMGRKKSEGKKKTLIVTGCLAQRYEQEIKEQLPEADVLVGTSAIESIVNAVEQSADLKAEHYYFKDIDYLAGSDAPRFVSGTGYCSYLKIAEGCDKRCTYCVIPQIRGRYRSVPMESLLGEARALADRGVRELILVAQETAMYGLDLYGKKTLHILLEKLCEIPGIHWIRVLYCYPEEIYPELLDVMAGERKICKYLDLPIQHASDRILSKMGRKTTEKDLRRIIAALRERIPGIALRTTLITGFPGETGRDHRILMDFVREMRFDRLGVFTYSAEENTPAAGFPGQITEITKRRRRSQIMKLQRRICEEKAAEHVGNVYEAVVEGKLPDRNVYLARTYMDIPDVDGSVFIETDSVIMTGSFIDVRITGSSGYDLVGEPA